MIMVDHVPGNLTQELLVQGPDGGKHLAVPLLTDVDHAVRVRTEQQHPVAVSTLTQEGGPWQVVPQVPRSVGLDDRHSRTEPPRGGHRPAQIGVPVRSQRRVL